MSKVDTTNDHEFAMKLQQQINEEEQNQPSSARMKPSSAIQVIIDTVFEALDDTKNEEEQRANNLAKDDGVLDTFFCPITGDVMENPVICIVSGNTYEASAIRKHFANCVEKGQKPYDPITRAIITDPYTQLVPNRLAKDAIEEWKKKKSNHKYPDASVFQMMEQNQLMKENNDNDLVRLRNQLNQENALKEKKLKDEPEQKRLSSDKKEQAINEKLRKAEDDVNNSNLSNNIMPKVDTTNDHEFAMKLQQQINEEEQNQQSSAHIKRAIRDTINAFFGAVDDIKNEEKN